MNYPAEEPCQADISYSFRDRRVTQMRPVVTGLYRQQLKTRQAGRALTVGHWMLEAYPVEAGAIEYHHGGRPCRRPRAANTIHLYRPGFVMREDTRNAAQPFREICFRFRGADICGLDAPAAAAGGCACFHDRQRQAITLMNEAADACLARGEKSFWIVQALFHRCLDLLTGAGAPVAPGTWRLESDASPEELFIEKTEAYMRRNIAGRIRNRDIAAFLNISESGFNHRFRQLTGAPPNARLLEMRIELARNMLRKGARLREIAAATGFRHECHLSRTFKRLTGLSPRDLQHGRK